MRTSVVVFAGLALMLASLAAWAQSEGPPGPFAGFKSTGDDPIELTARRLEADLINGKVLFIGRVVAKQGQRTIYAERMDVRYTQEGEITSLVASGNVKVRMKDAFATSDKLTLDNVKKVIKLIGKPKVVQGKQIVTGKLITYYMKTERLVVDKPRIEWAPDESVPGVKEGGP